jgi:Low affinity iron permease
VRQCLDAEAVLTHKFEPTLTRLGALVAHPTAFIILVCYVGVWLISDRRNFDWQAVATIATLLMTLFIQRAEHRDTQAIHAKLDECCGPRAGRAANWHRSTMRSPRSLSSTAGKNAGKISRLRSALAPSEFGGRA